MRLAAEAVTLSLKGCYFLEPWRPILRSLSYVSFTSASKLRLSSWSRGGLLRVLLRIELLTFEERLRKNTSRTIFVFKSCDFPAGLQNLLFVLLSYRKAATFELGLRKCTLCTTVMNVLRTAPRQFRDGVAKVISVLAKIAVSETRNFRQPSNMSFIDR